MDIIFETSGSTAPLKQWLQVFKEIDDSLLLEIDLADDLFVTKTFTTDRTIVKYGKIGFADCNISVVNVLDENNNAVSVSEWIEKHPQRIYVGILHQLANFIQTVDLYSGEDVHKIIVRFKEVEGRYQAYNVDFKSRTLLMPTPCYNLSEFNLSMLDDSVFFNRVAAIQSPITFEVASSANKTLVKASEIYTKDPKKDILDFSIANDEEGTVLRVKDHNNHTYNQILSFTVVEGGPVNQVSVSPVTRSNYIIGIKGDVSDKSLITVSTQSQQNGRMKIETSDGMFTTIIANVRV